MPEAGGAGAQRGARSSNATPHLGVTSIYEMVIREMVVTSPPVSLAVQH